ncbi:YybH family protein [Propionivibrio soli]|uniref:YybH family protein n=1 Tax=Propionivibrio soli TaxID=2976531 RepID=UPI0021E8BA34|nr:nuclear transport factor 2 family protein [Propionivibrio soli]
MRTLYTSSEDAEEAFYNAIGHGDIDALMNVWAEDEEIVCIHPTGQRITGVGAIRESWQAIFGDNARFSMQARCLVRWESMLLCIHSVIETLYVGDEPMPHAQMLTTNVYQRGADGWRLLVHHATPASEADHEGADFADDFGGGERTLH